MVKAFLVAGAAAAAFVGAQASAATYVFNYTFASTGNTVTGSLEGTLAADNNTFNITGLNSYLVNGVATDATIVGSLDQAFGVGGTGPAVKLDGSFIDLYLQPDLYTDVAIFSVGTGAASVLGMSSVAATPNYGATGLFEGFVAANYSGAIVTAGADVPEPAAWALMIGGFGMIGSNFRRRKVAMKIAFA